MVQLSDAVVNVGNPLEGFYWTGAGVRKLSENGSGIGLLIFCRLKKC